jgi:hypothetical protein
MGELARGTTPQHRQRQVLRRDVGRSDGARVGSGTWYRRYQQTSRVDTEEIARAVVSCESDKAPMMIQRRSVLRPAGVDSLREGRRRSPRYDRLLRDVAGRRQDLRPGQKMFLRDLGRYPS